MTFLPDPRTRGDLHFRAAKFLPYGCRLLMLLACLGAGLLVQFLFNFYAGLPLLLLATLLGAVKGYKVNPVPTGKEEWQQVDAAAFAKIKAKADALKKWDADLFDISCGRGGCLFVAVAFGLLLLSINMAAEFADEWFFIVAADAVILLLPQWFIGTRTYLTNDQLVIITQLLLRCIEWVKPFPGLTAQPLLALKKVRDGEGTLPVNARLMLRVADAPAWFLGVQVQVNINDVQGTSYPYLYCVLVAKQEGKMVARAGNVKGALKPFTGITVETQSEDGVDVIIIRQATTRTSGYHTNDKAVRGILTAAAGATGLVLGRDELARFLKL